MGRQIIKQPNGLFAIWSSVVDNFIVLNYTAQQIVDKYIEEEKKRITESVANDIKLLEAGESPYYQFTKTWDGALQSIEIYHGKEEVTKLLKYYAEKEKK